MRRWTILFLLGSISLFGKDADVELVGWDEFANKFDLQSYLLTRADELPVESFEDATDPYLEGYIQALIDVHYTEFQVVVSVKDHKVYLSNLPKNKLIANSIISFVGEVPGVESVEVEPVMDEKELAARELYVEQPRINGIWFPQQTVLFQPLIADPREPMYSAVFRYGDDVVGTTAVTVSLGDSFPIFRWKNVWCWHGDLQIDIQAGVWAVFNFHDVPDHGRGDTCELVNQDYLLGIPLSYAFDAWSFRLRIYHISAHLGDEFIVNNPCFVCCRVNPSFEAIDLYASYQWTMGIRVYFGPGVVIHSDKSFKIDPLYITYGTEIRMFGKKHPYHGLYGTPFLAIFIQNWQQHNWDFDLFVRAGYEVSKLQGIGRKMRLFLGFHTGYSYEGQFFNCKTTYGELGLSWGF